MGKASCFKAGILIGVEVLLLGCAAVRDAEIVGRLGGATTRDAQMLNERISILQLQLNTVQTEKDSLWNEFTAFRKEAQNDISILKKELASSQKESKTNISTLQEEKNLLQADFTAEMKSLQSDLLLRLQALQSQANRIQTEKDSLKNDFTVVFDDIRRTQSDVSLRLQALQSQVNSVEVEKDSLRNEFIAFQKEAQQDLLALKEGDKLLNAGLSKETQKVRTEFLLRLAALESEIRMLSAGIEDYKAFLKKSLVEIDRLQEDLALRMKGLDEKGKTLEARHQVQEDRARATEERVRWVEDRYKDVDGKMVAMALKQAEFEKSLAVKGRPPEIKASFAVGGLYKDAYETFLKGDLEKARNRFEIFLKEYPDTELSDNAQFWIGETYYQKGDFEKAVLEYEKVIAKYPESDRVSTALFKQALVFLELGDKTNARNLLRRVIERYPQFEQVEAAKKKLESIR